MARFIVSYDLYGKDRYDDFHSIEDELRDLGAISIQYSVWYYEGNLSAESIEQALAPFMNPHPGGDSLAIAPVADPDEWRGFNLGDDS